MARISWKLRLVCAVLVIVGGGSLVDASEVGLGPSPTVTAVARRPGPAPEPRHDEPGLALLTRVGMVGVPDVTGTRFPSGLKIRGGTKHRMILFSFDDGPSKRTTPRLLDTLDALDIRGLFFVTSEIFGNGSPWEREHAEIVREIVRRGHTLGNHTETHRQLPLLRNVEVEAELRRSGRKIAWTVGSHPRLIRPPGGALSKRIEGLLADNGYTSVMWALYPADLEVDTPEDVVRSFFRVLDRREQDTGDRGGIVLMHDTKAHSVEALPRIVEALRRRNCRLLAEDPDAELYDIVGDLGYFIPGYEPDPPLDERQLALRTHFAQACGALALID